MTSLVCTINESLTFQACFARSWTLTLWTTVISITTKTTKTKKTTRPWCLMSSLQNVVDFAQTLQELQAMLASAQAAAASKIPPTPILQPHVRVAFTMLPAVLKSQSGQRNWSHQVLAAKSLQAQDCQPHYSANLWGQKSLICYRGIWIADLHLWIITKG